MMEKEHITVLELDIDPFAPSSNDVPAQGSADLVSLETIDPCMPMLFDRSYSNGTSCLSPFDVDVLNDNRMLTDLTDKHQYSTALHEPDFSTRALSPLFDELDDKYDATNACPYDLQGESSQSSCKYEYDPAFQVEYATEYSSDLAEYNQVVTPKKDRMWQSYEMSDSDDSWIPDYDKENTESPKKFKSSYKKHKKSSKATKALAKSTLTPKSSPSCAKGSNRLFSAEERLDLARYAAGHGIDEAVTHFSHIWQRSVSKKVVITALEKYKMVKRSRHVEPTVEMMQATNKFTQVDREQMAASCRKVGPTKTAKIFSEKLGMIISESTVRGFAKKY